MYGLVKGVQFTYKHLGIDIPKYVDAFLVYRYYAHLYF